MDDSNKPKTWWNPTDDKFLVANPELIWTVQAINFACFESKMSNIKHDSAIKCVRKVRQVEYGSIGVLYHKNMSVITIQKTTEELLIVCSGENATKNLRRAQLP